MIVAMTVGTCTASIEQEGQDHLYGLNPMGLELKVNNGLSRRSPLCSNAAMVLLRGSRMALSSELMSSISEYSMAKWAIDRRRQENDSFSVVFIGTLDITDHVGLDGDLLNTTVCFKEMISEAIAMD